VSIMLNHNCNSSNELSTIPILGKPKTMFVQTVSNCNNKISTVATMIAIKTTA
jgi:hypothetical protein